MRRTSLITIVLVLLLAASGAAEEPSTRLLIFSRTAGFRHGSIPHAVTVLRQLCAENGLESDATEDATVFTVDRLAGYDVVVFLNTTGDVLDDAQQAAFEGFVRGGGGFVGIHAATDTEYDWPWYGKLVGARFKRHPAVQSARVVVVDAEHPSTRHLPASWTRTDEWYDFDPAPVRDGAIHVLLELDESSYEDGGMGTWHPIAWCHEMDGGRAWYTGGGHTPESFDEPLFRKHLLGGIRWAAGECNHRDTETQRLHREEMKRVSD